METLTPERIAELLSTTKQRGVYVGPIKDFIDSDELSMNFSDLPYFRGKDAQATKNSITGNIEKHGAEDWPALTVLFDKPEGSGKDKTKWNVILVNLDKLAEVQATQNDEVEEEDEVTA